MMASQRRRHFRTWAVTAPLLVTAVWVAFLQSPPVPTDEFRQSHVGYPELQRSVVSRNYVFNIRKNYSGGSVLEVMQISSINPVTEFVELKYSSGRNQKKTTQVLGIMGPASVYVFNLPAVESPFEVRVTDTIKKEELARIDF